MKTHIIAIHGLNNKPSPATLLERWQLAIDEGLRRNQGANGIGRYELEMVYWADLGYSEPLSEDEAGYTYEPYGGDGPLPEYEPGWKDRLIIEALKAGGKIADVIGTTFGRNFFSDRLLARLYADLSTYYDDEERREKVRERLVEALAKPREGKLVLLSHSMGTIVAMDVLRLLEKENRAPRVPAFITMGSPLGLPYVIHRHKNEFGNPATPECVARWGNFSEKRDRICADPHLADDYDENRLGVEVEDDLIFNTHPTNPHDAHGYLRCPEVSRCLVSLLEA